ncbi:MAG: ParB N-terminal domain-containing protein [Verrucomicrobia bacterium]|nr:ParB N-terminal domain-containing protein [Verrucomicrobiota bacterium]
MEERSIEFRKLLGSIENLGQQDPIVVDGDTLIDGRHRLRACEYLGIEPKVVEWKTLGFDDSMGEWIMLKNLERRHLTPEQRVQIATNAESWIIEESNAKHRGETQFKPGASPNPTGKRKEQVTSNSTSPARDRRKAEASTTAGKLAAKAGTTIHKARQAIKIQKAVDAGKIPQADLDGVIAGTTKPVEVLKKIEPKATGKPKKSKILARLITLWKKATQEERNQFMKEVE